MSKDRLTVVWTPEDHRQMIRDFRILVTAQRALQADEYDTAAPVIDIRTRARLA